MNRIATTYQAYKTGTGWKGNQQRRGINKYIHHVDKAFEDYETEFQPPQSTQPTQIAVTLNLYNACKNWLRDKQGKSDIKKPFLRPDYTNQTLVDRRNMISEVAKECLGTLRQLPTTGAAGLKFNERKINMLAKGRRAAPVVPLHSFYGLERLTWTESGKTAALSPRPVDGAKGMTKARMNELTLKEYQALAAQAGNKEVLYFKKAARLRYMVEIDANGLLCSASTRQQLHCNLPALDKKSPKAFFKELHAYAIDRYGNLFESQEFTSPQLQQYGANVKYFNHSTFNAGRDVICAGCIGIQNGQLVWIDQHSGHYKPTRRNLKEAVELLETDGADLTQTLVAAYNYKPSGDIDTIDLFSAPQFLSNPEGKPDKGSI
jgi:hypothetical protein